MENYYSGGSGFGGTYFSLTDGKTREIFEIDDFVCFCKIKNVVLIPPKLRETINKSFLEVLEKRLLSNSEKLTTPDPSLQWLLSANGNFEKLKNNPYYDLFIHTPTVWISGEIEIPQTYHMDVSGEALHLLYSTDTEPPAWYGSKFDEGWLIYYGHNHKEIKLVDDATSLKIFKTSHGIVVKRNEHHAWLFVTDYDLTEAPDKLRRASIGDLKLINNFIVFELNINPSHKRTFIINPETGIVGRLKHESSSSFKIDDNRILFGDSDIVYNVKELFDELNN